jgi:hypothetical protein
MGGMEVMEVWLGPHFFFEFLFEGFEEFFGA